MNSQGASGWMPPTGPARSPPTNEHAQAQQRPPGSFGHNLPLQPSSQPQMSGPSLLQQPAPFYQSQHSAHNLPNPQNLPHSSPPQHARGPPSVQQSPPSIQQRPIQAPGYNLPTLGPVMQHQQPSQGPSEAERENLERERAREHEMRQEILAHEQQRRYEHENELLHQQREQQQREQQQQQQQQQQRERHPSPRENHIGAIPIQQPVASRVPATLHGPNGILNDQHPASGPPSSQSSLPMGAPSGPGNVFNNPVQGSNEAGMRPYAQQAQSLPTQQALGINNAATPQQLPSGAALSQQQQPILNDALSYLDQVKVQFQAEPDVYNRFLDIMKDFKSQAIDTPGVIDRVSQLFTGHPQLIQGFNTFLPPGYRIECGTRDDPNAIRVTTPMGTTVQQMPSLQNRLGGPNGVVHEGARSGFYGDGQPSGEWVSHQQEMGHQSEQQYSGGPVSLMDMEARLQQERSDHASVADSMIVHQDEQRGVSHLVSAASNGGQVRATAAQISPGPGQGMSFAQGAPGLSNATAIQANQLGMERRGPVEFNHAIGYVNKIKNRFAQQPEIYRQFLEILQNYQRESKPIQDVYAQVTQLFSSAPDLLEDFKQFLPESAAHAKAQAQAQAAAKLAEDTTMSSSIRNEPPYAGPPHAQVQTPRPEIKMPPVGNFAPPSVGKDNKKRRGGPGSQVTGGAAAPDSTVNLGSQINRNGVRGAPVNKRARTEQAKPSAPEVPPVSPTLVPALPTPIPPSKEMTGVQEHLAFFDRVKKFVSNKQTFNEFLKLCNLFTQELIDKNTLMLKAHNFIGGNTELASWFKNWIEFDGRDEMVENKPRIPGDKVVLSNCRGLGPSYRLLPKRERLRECRGRDEICHQVLNDTWVSHPTWASEDSGFVAHRKNTFEEALHRIEEERHDYDINVEACSRTVQLMEPIAQQFQLMTEKERFDYRLPPGLGGQSETIYQRVIKKIYDRERGGKVIDDMFKHPVAVLPVVLGRLKQKLEEWKASQREWEKIWRDQTYRIFWKSLDHQGINTKTAEKRQFQPKTLQTEIQVKYEEQRRQKIIPWNTVPNYQFRYGFTDMEVIQDACHLILTQLQHAFVGNDLDKSRLETFIKTFIPTFFDIDRDVFDVKMSDIYDTTPPNEEAEEETADAESSTPRGRRVNGKKATLLRGVLERSKAGQKEEVESKESTPDVQSNEEDTPASTGTPTEQPQVDAFEHRWLSHPLSGNKSVDLNSPFKRDNFHLYASVNIYCFFRMFEMLYERLLKLKDNEDQVHKDVQRSKMPKPADKLGLSDKKPGDFFADITPSANYYDQILNMFEDVIKGDVENSHLEETLRRFYMKSGWQMYSFDKMLAAMLRFALQILISDNKDKSLDIINLFYKDRKEDETTHQAELTYRKQVEKLTKEGDIYRIRYNRAARSATIQIFTKESKTYEADELAAHARWSYYVSSFSMLDRTEGVPPEKLSFPFLRRNLPAKLDTEEEYSETYPPSYNEDGLVIRISPNSYHMLYDPGTVDWWVHGPKQQKRGLGMYERVKEGRRKGLQALIEDKERNAWMKEMTAEGVDQVNADFRTWIQLGPKDVRDQREKAAIAAATAITDAVAPSSVRDVSTTAGIAGDDHVMGGT